MLNPDEQTKVARTPIRAVLIKLKCSQQIESQQE